MKKEFKNLMAQLARDKNMNFTLQSVLPGEVIILNLTSETGITALQYYSNFTFTVKLVFDKAKGRIFTLGRIDQLIESAEAFISIDSEFKKFSLIPLLNAYKDGSLDISPLLPVRAADDKLNYMTLRTIISSQLPENLWFSEDDGVWHTVAQMSGLLSCLISQTRLAYRSKTPMLMNIPSPSSQNYAPAYFSTTTPRRRPNWDRDYHRQEDAEGHSQHYNYYRDENQQGYGLRQQT